MDWHLYNIRHLVENAFSKLKNYRAIATRFDKPKQSYENTVALICAYLWLKIMNVQQALFFSSIFKRF